MRFVLRSGSVQKRIGWTRRRSISKVETPESADFQRHPAWANHVPKRSASHRIECIDVSVPKVANQKGTAELAEVGWSDLQTPGRIESPVGGEPLYHVSIQIEDVYKTVSRAFCIIVLSRVLQSEGHVKHSIQRSNSEGRVTGGKGRVSKTPDPLKTGVVLFHPAAIKIGRVDKSTVGVLADSQTFINGARTRVVHGEN